MEEEQFRRDFEQLTGNPPLSRQRRLRRERMLTGADPTRASACPIEKLAPDLTACRLHARQRIASEVSSFIAGFRQKKAAGRGSRELRRSPEGGACDLTLVA
ncbi:MAG TPA: hypothetical protein VN541_06505 [Tepidisphaeraceae bacterium]|nr:hypothetical protein [Tepidisphaeraceae bacterium]